MKYLKLSLSFLFTIIVCYQTKATHLWGGEITYRHLGADSYLVSFVIYRDCNGISLGSQNISVYDCKFSAVASGIGSATQKAVVDITPLSAGHCSKCAASCSGSRITYGYEAYHYVQKIDLAKSKSAKCCNFYLTWDNCCRSGSITTGSSGESFHIETILNACAGGDNSVSFTSPAMVMIAQNQHVEFNPGAIDPDTDSHGFRDSLVYSITKPLQTRTSTTTTTYNSWSGKYAYNKPLFFDSFPKINAQWNLPSGAGFHVDSFSGQVFFTPTKVEITVLALNVQSWGKDSKGRPYMKSSVTRDLSLTIVKSPNHGPLLSNIDSGAHSDTTVFAGHSICFTIFSNDQDTSDKVKLSWNQQIPKASFTIDTTRRRQKATFCWKPDTSYISSQYYQFVVTATDLDSSAIQGRASRAYRVKVVPEGQDTITIGSSTCGTINFSASPKPRNEISTYTWYGDDKLSSSSKSFSHTYSRSGSYKYYLKVTNKYGYKRIDSGLVIVPSLLYTKFTNDTSLCSSAPLALTFKATTGSGTPPFHYKWSTGDTTASITQTISKSTFFTVQVKDSSCTNIDTIRVNFNSIPVVTVIHDTFACQGSIVPLNLSSLVLSPTGGTWSGNGVSGKYFYQDSSSVSAGKSMVIYSYTDMITHCSNRDTANINVFKALHPDAGIYGPYCADNSTYPLKDTTISYTWMIGDFTTSSSALTSSKGIYYFNSGGQKAGAHRLVFEESYSGHCPAFDTATILINALPATPSINVSGGDTLSASFAAAYYQWYKDSVKLADTSRKIVAFTKGSYQVQCIDANGCISSLSGPYKITVTGIIQDGINDAGFRIYPNPSSGLLTIETPGSKDEMVSIINLTGQVLLQSKINEKTDLDLQHLPKGIYLVRLEGRNAVTVKQIVLQ